MGTGDVTADRPPEMTPEAIGRLEQFYATLEPGERAALRALVVSAAVDRSRCALGAVPAEEILSRGELKTFERLRADDLPVMDGGRAAMTLIVKATRLCNLRCRYCHSWRTGPNQVMSFDVLVRTIRDALWAPSARRVEFVWHGGEVTMLSPRYLRRALWLQEQFRRPGQQVHNSIQTNGVGISDEWLELLRFHGFAVGVSLDGPPELHDTRRRDVHGEPTAHLVAEGIRRLREAGIEGLGVLMVVDRHVCEMEPRALLDYFVDAGITQVSLLNRLPSNDGDEGRENEYLDIPEFVVYLREMLPIYHSEYRQRVKVRELEEIYTVLGGAPPLTCVLEGDCVGAYVTIEPSGEVASCDKFQGDPDYVFGNLRTDALGTILATARVAAIRQSNHADVRAVATCRWYRYCRGGCPHERYLARRFGSAGPESCCGLAPMFEDVAALEATSAGGTG